MKWNGFVFNMAISLHTVIEHMLYNEHDVNQTKKTAWILGRKHRRSQDFCLGGAPGRRLPAMHHSVVHTFEAVAGSWGSVSAPAVNRVMGGAQERNRNKNRKKNLGEMTFGGGFL